MALLAELKAEKTRSALYQNRSYQQTRRLNRLNASKRVTLQNLEVAKADFANKLEIPSRILVALYLLLKRSLRSSRHFWITLKLT